MKKAITQMIQSLLLSLAARSQLQELREKLRSPVVDKGPVLKAKPPAAQKDILGVCSDPLVLAQQLTHIELVSAAACSRIVWSGVGPHLALLRQWCCKDASLLVSLGRAREAGLLALALTVAVSCVFIHRSNGYFCLALGL